MIVALTRSRNCAAHTTRAACCRERLSAGNKIEISKAMIPITTSNSTSVNARGRMDDEAFERSVLHDAMRASRKEKK
jgi:hypothetical protein